MKKEVKLLNDIDEISRLGIFVEELGEELSLSPEITMNINLALEEAIANIIMYAYPTEERHDIILSVNYTEHQLIFLLSDTGKSFDPTQANDVDLNLSLEERPIGGLGIYLIRQIMNEVTYERIGNENKLTMKKILDAEER